MGGFLRCIDAFCYHLGGPLEAGDIEDIGGTACVRCPLHGKRFSLSTGLELNGRTGEPVCPDRQQRCHAASVDAEGVVWVEVDNAPSAVPSDRVNCSHVRRATPSHEASTSATAAPPSPLMPLGADAPRIPLVPSPADALRLRSAALPSPFFPPLQNVCPAVLLPFAGDKPIPSPPPPDRSTLHMSGVASSNLLKTAGFRARKTAATGAVLQKPVTPPVAAGAADAAKRSAMRQLNQGYVQQDIRTALQRGSAPPAPLLADSTARALRFDDEAMAMEF